MNVVIIRVIPAEVLEGVEREPISTMVINSLESRKCEEKNCLSDCKTGTRHRCDITERIHDKRLDWMAVQCAKCVGNIDSVMDGVDVFIEKLVFVDKAMDKIFPCVSDEPAHPEVSKPYKL